MFQSVLYAVAQRIELILTKQGHASQRFNALNSQSLSNPLVRFTLLCLIHMTDFNSCTYLTTFVIHFYSY